MKGGKYYVPRKDLNRFYKHLVAEMHTNDTHFHLVEQVQQSFRFFLDLDFGKHFATDDDLKTIFRVIYDDGKRGGDMFISLCAREEKLGIHIVFPGHITDVSKASVKCSEIFDELKTNVSGYAWNEIIDTKPYRSGLRQLYSFKFVNGKEDVPYVPYCRLWKGGYTPLESCNRVELLETFSIFPPDLEFKPKVVPKKLEVDNVLDAFIRRVYRGWGGSDTVTGVRRVSERKFQAFTNSRFCAVVNGRHRSNHIWFDIERRNTSWRLKARCHNETCDSNDAKEYPVPPSLIKFISSL